MSRESLQLLGITPEKARETIQTFRDYDDDLIERQQAIYDDEARMIESAQSAVAELESLFDEDIGKARKMDLSTLYSVLKNKVAPDDSTLKDNTLTDSTSENSILNNSTEKDNPKK